MNKSVNLSEQDLITFKEDCSHNTSKESQSTSTSSISKSSSLLSYSANSSQLNLSSEAVETRHETKPLNSFSPNRRINTKQQFRVEHFDFFKVNTESIFTQDCDNNFSRDHKLASYLETEIKKHLDELENIVASGSNNKTAKKSDTEEFSNEENSDVIPFDECEYEKIAISSSSAEFTAKKPQMLDQSIESSESSGSMAMSSSDSNSENKKETKETSLMKNSRTESEINDMKKFSRTRHRLAHQRKNSVYNDLSYYYSLTDVKCIALDDDEEEKNISSSSLSSSSPSSSASSSRRTYSSQSLDEDHDFFGKLQKSITLPKTNEMTHLGSIDAHLPRSKSSLSLHSNTSSIEKSDRVSEMPRSFYSNPNHKSLSEYCMNDILKQKRRRRLIRFLKGNQAEFLEKMRFHRRSSLKSLALSDFADESDESGAPTPIRRQKRSKCNICISDNCVGYSGIKDGAECDDEADEEDFYQANLTPTTTTNSSLETSSSLNPESPVDTETSPAKVNNDNKPETTKPINLSNDNNQISNNSTAVVNNENGNLAVPGIDETSTTNTDVSDPHWDGYTVRLKDYYTFLRIKHIFQAFLNIVCTK